MPGNENNFMATRCDSFTALKAGNCHGKPIPMGYATPKTAKGDYFLETNAAKPYGQRLPIVEDKDKTCTDYL